MNVIDERPRSLWIRIDGTSDWLVHGPFNEKDGPDGWGEIGKAISDSGKFVIPVVSGCTPENQ